MWFVEPLQHILSVYSRLRRQRIHKKTKKKDEKKKKKTENAFVSSQFRIWIHSWPLFSFQVKLVIFLFNTINFFSRMSLWPSLSISTERCESLNGTRLACTQQWMCRLNLIANGEFRKLYFVFNFTQLTHKIEFRIWFQQRVLPIHLKYARKYIQYFKKNSILVEKKLLFFLAKKRIAIVKICI